MLKVNLDMGSPFEGGMFPDRRAFFSRDKNEVKPNPRNLVFDLGSYPGAHNFNLGHRAGKHTVKYVQG
jgi:hypothetical protein